MSQQDYSALMIQLIRAPSWEHVANRNAQNNSHEDCSLLSVYFLIFDWTIVKVSEN